MIKNSEVTNKKQKGKAKHSKLSEQVRQIKKKGIISYVKEHKATAELILGVIIVLLVISFFVINSHPGKIGVDTKYAPFVAKVYINGAEVKNNHKNYLAPGEYTVKIELEHFETIEKTITVSDTFSSLIGGLQPIDAEGDKIYYEKIVDYRKANSADTSPELTGNIYKKLPIENSLYRIVQAYDEEENNRMIRIYAGEPYVETAVSALYKNLQYDEAIAGYKIVLAQYNDIFKEPAESHASAATDVVKETYASAINDTYIFKEELHSGRYTAVVMCTQQNTGGAFYRAYRTILERDGSTWRILRAPYPVVSKGFFPDVETTFLNRINLVKCGK